jgi:predicted helicase
MLIRSDFIIQQRIRELISRKADWRHIGEAINAIIKEHQMAQFNYRNSVADLLGRIVVPTGGGKTSIQAGGLEYIIRLDGKNVHVVVAPRLALCNQLSVEYRNKIKEDYLALSFHSGRHEADYTKIAWSETNTTSTEKVQAEIERAKRLRVDLVIFTTYHSLGRLLDFEFDSAFFDESQYCTGKQWFDSVRNLKAKVKLFFTATEKVMDEDIVDEHSRALNNESVFGGIIYRVSPQTLIERGCIVAPLAHFQQASRTGENSLLNYVIESVTYQHKYHVEERGMPFSKTLVCANGTKDIKQVSDNHRVLKAKFPEHTIYTIISDARYGAMIDGVKTARNEFFKRLREPGNAIVIHYDIISEGIDIPGFTGVVIDRWMDKAKLLQSIGRALRVYRKSPALKPFALITIPIWNNDSELENWAGEMIKQIRAGGFEIMEENIRYTGHESGDGEETDPDELAKARNTIHKIFNVCHRLEDLDEEEALNKESVESLLARMPNFAVFS